MYNYCWTIIVKLEVKYKNQLLLNVGFYIIIYNIKFSFIKFKLV